MIALYRVRQGLRALLAFTRRVDHTLAAAHLNPPQMMLFRQMRRSEQLHSLNVLRDVLTLQSSAGDAISAMNFSDIAVAALLHDVGKTCYPLAIWQKTLVVLVRAFAHPLYNRWSKGDPANIWQRAFVVAEQHPEWGAALVSSTGLSDRALWLIAHHADDATQWQDDSYVHLLKRLQQADDAN
ncbi:MAG: HD domain-containing protein [Chitinophagaceae bacterium]|nr:HD domain-containing protein [Anaerolineae bacterium]